MAIVCEELAQGPYTAMSQMRLVPVRSMIQAECSNWYVTMPQCHWRCWRV